MKKVYPALIALFIALCAFAGTFFGYNASVFLDVLRHPERRAALDAAWYTHSVVSAAIPAVIFALVFIAAYFYRAEKKNRQDNADGESE